MKLMPSDWITRRDCDKPLQIKTLEKSFSDIPAGATMLVVTPKLMDKFIRQIPFGETVEQPAIRKALAGKYGAQYACPVTTGIALRVVSEAAYLELLNGSEESDVTPFWRAVAPDGTLSLKLACGRSFLEMMRTKERA